MKKELENLTRSIIRHTSNWILTDWKVFRSKNDYWSVRDLHTRTLLSLKPNSLEYISEEISFKQWKLNEIIQYNNN